MRNVTVFFGVLIKRYLISRRLKRPRIDNDLMTWGIMQPRKLFVSGLAFTGLAACAGGVTSNTRSFKTESLRAPECNNPLSRWPVSDACAPPGGGHKPLDNPPAPTQPQIVQQSRLSVYPDSGGSGQPVVHILAANGAITQSGLPSGTTLVSYINGTYNPSQAASVVTLMLAG